MCVAECGDAKAQPWKNRADKDRNYARITPPRIAKLRNLLSSPLRKTVGGYAAFSRATGDDEELRFTKHTNKPNANFPAENGRGEEKQKRYGLSAEVNSRQLRRHSMEDTLRPHRPAVRRAPGTVPPSPGAYREEVTSFHMYPVDAGIGYTSIYVYGVLTGPCFLYLHVLYILSRYSQQAYVPGLWYGLVCDSEGLRRFPNGRLIRARPRQ